MNPNADANRRTVRQDDLRSSPIEIGSVSRTIRARSSSLADALNKGCDLLDCGDFTAAINQFTLVIGMNRRCISAYLNRGLAYLRIKNFDAAIRDTKSALKINKQSADAHSNLGLVYQEIGDLDRAMACFTAAMESDTNHAVSRLNRATILYTTGKADQARQEWIEVLKLDPCGSAGRAAQNNLTRMMREQKKNRYKQAAPSDKE